MQYSALRAAVHVAAVLSLYLSAAMLVPAAVDLYYGHEDWRVFAFTAAFSGALALAVALATRGAPPVVSARFGFLLVNLLWVTTSLVGAAPLVASPLGLGLADAVFEAVSGITTTGATAISRLDGLPPGILLWRSILQWIGGLGVIALGLFILPFLNLGGFSFLKLETSDFGERPFARLSTYLTSMIGIYGGLTVLCAVLYAAAGMEGFDAVNHAMTTISTAGFSTHDASMGYYADNPAILWIAVVFMFVGALPFAILMMLAVSGGADSLRDPQIRLFAGYVAFFVAAATLYASVSGRIPPAEAFTHAAFNFVSLLTTTGFASADYAAWGPFAAIAAFLATFPGGCSGSTSGGVKAYRLVILFSLIANGLRRLVYPSSVQSVRYGARPVDEAMQRAVALYLFAFLFVWLAAAALLGAAGLEPVTAVTGALTALTNVGPGLGGAIGPAGNFSAVPDAAKWVLAGVMLMGRLEILAVLVILTPTFWRR